MIFPNIKNVGCVLLWDNLGPIHVDRANALQAAVPTVVVELFPNSHEYIWTYRPNNTFSHITVAKSRPATLLQNLSFVARLIRTMFRTKKSTFFLCNYERWYIFVTAVALRLAGKRVFVMQDSKFDDYSRFLWREVGKALLYAPYLGAIVGSERSAEYLKFLGLRRITLGYNSSSVDRLRSYDGGGGYHFLDRPFVFLARLIPKKNSLFLLEVYSRYVEAEVATGASPRRLVIVGDGPEREAVNNAIAAGGLEDLVEMRGWLQEPEAMEILRSSVALLLPSIEEQFGNVAGEACSLGIPSIVSMNCGSRRLIDDFLNGFVLEIDSPQVWACGMAYIAASEARWGQLSRYARDVAYKRWDVANFRNGILALASKLDEPNT